MKVRSFPIPRSLLATLAQGRTILRSFWHLLCACRWVSLGLFVAVFGLGYLMMPYDRALLKGIHIWEGHQDTIVRIYATKFSFWGDYPTYNLPFAILVWFYGVWRKSPAWRRAAVIYLLGATLAGIFDDCFRLTLGRPRPDAHYMDGFYGLPTALGSRFQSFPSGHSASVFGASVALLFVNRPLGLLTLAFAFAVAWSRMELNRHYPVDVAVGALVGLYFGVMIGFASRLRRTRSRP